MPRGSVPFGLKLAAWALGALCFAFLALGVFLAARPDAARRVPFVRFALPPSAPAPTVNERLSTVSFSDIFSGDGWLDISRTDMFRDTVTTGFLFPPVAVRNALDPAEAERVLARGRAVREACIRGRCAAVRAGAVTAGGPSVRIPVPAGGVLRSARADALDTGWIVGAVVLKDDGGFEGYLYRFDGAKLSPVPATGEPAVKSRYEGMFGISGADGDWLAVYGAYEGRAMRVRDGEIADVSRFVAERAMRGGFEPLVRRADRGASWYVWSATQGTPALLKLWEVEPGELGGATDLTSLIIGAGEVRAEMSFDGAPAGYPRFVARIENEQGGRTYWALDDRGFDEGAPREVVSRNVHTDGRAVRSASFRPLELAKASGVRFFLSNDGKKWQEVREGEEAAFPDGKSGLFWRAVFAVPQKGAPSPFFGGIHLDYKVDSL